MHNLYSITTNQDAVRRLFKAVNSRVGDLSPLGFFGMSALARAAPVMFWAQDLSIAGSSQT
jgi:hypothetical protein